VADERFARWAAGVLSAARGHLVPRPDEAPGVTVARLEEAIVATGRRRRRRRTIVRYGVAGLATVAAIVFVMRSPRAPAPGPLARSPMTIEGRQPLAAGAAIETAESALTLLSSDGTRARVGPRSDLRLTRDDVVRWFRLVRGAVSLQVAKLPHGHRFVVETPDREVEVKGTAFEVRVLSPHELTKDPGCAVQTLTRVIVEEGVVIVRGPDGFEELIRAGSSWPAGCPAEVTSAGVAARGPVAPPQVSAPAARPSSAPRSRASHPEPSTAPTSEGASTLAVENDLFSAAVRAERAGDRRGALRTLDELLLRYPASPLRDAAATERRKLAESTAVVSGGAR
jgi:hypothetical protein